MSDNGSESQGFFSGLFRVFQQFWNFLGNLLSRISDFLLWAIAGIGHLLMLGISWLFQQACVIISHLLAVPAMLIGVVLTLLGAVLGVVVGVVVTFTGFPLQVESALTSLLQDLGLSGFGYFLHEYLAFNSLIAFGLTFFGFTVILLGLGLVCRLVWHLVPSL